MEQLCFASLRFCVCVCFPSACLCSFLATCLSVSEVWVPASQSETGMPDCWDTRGIPQDDILISGPGESSLFGGCV